MRVLHLHFLLTGWLLLLPTARAASANGGSFGSSSLFQEIGLGNATALSSVEIFWPASGTRQNLTGFALGRAYRIREDGSVPVAWELKRINFVGLTAQAHGH